MSGETDSGQGLPVVTLPTLTPSDNPAVAQTSTPQLSEAQLDAMIDRRLRSMKDRRLKVLDDLGGVEVLEQYVKANGGDVRKAAREIQLDALLDQPSDVPAQVPQPAPGKAAPAGPDRTALAATTISLLNDAGIPTNDPEYLALANKGYSGEAQFLTALAGLAVRRAKAGATAPEPPTAATAAAAGGGGIPANLTHDQKTAALTTKLATLHPADKEYKATMLLLEAQLRG